MKPSNGSYRSEALFLSRFGQNGSVANFKFEHSRFKAFHSAAAALAGIEVAHMIREKQFANDHRSTFKGFAELAS
jgi:transposase-like protein